MPPTKQEALKEALTAGQGVDIRQKMQVENIKKEFQVIQECAEEWEKICIKNNLTIQQMDQVWSALQERQNKMLRKIQVSKTLRPNLVIRDELGKPVNI